MLLDWKNRTPGSGIFLKFHAGSGTDNPLTQDYYGGLAAVENYYGLDPNCPEAVFYPVVEKWFSDHPNGTIAITRTGIGQRPHLLGYRLGITPDQLEGVHGNFSLSFDGYDYSGHVNFAGVTAAAAANGVSIMQQAGVRLAWAINQSRSIVATADAVVTSESLPFIAMGQGSQLYISANSPVQQLVLGGHADSHPDKPDGSMVLGDRGTTGLPDGASGHWSVFSRGYADTTFKNYTETFSYANLSNVTGLLKLGDEVIGDGVPADTTVVGINGSQVTFSEAFNLVGPLQFEDPPISVIANEVVGPTATSNSFEVQPAKGTFDTYPSTLGYMTGAVADALHLSQATGAVDSWDGGNIDGIHTINQMMNQLAGEEPFGSWGGSQYNRFGLPGGPWDTWNQNWNLLNPSDQRTFIGDLRTYGQGAHDAPDHWSVTSNGRG
jgi:hypothetical protein